MNRLSGKIALVTGSSRGIGRTIVIGLAREGALVAVHYAPHPSPTKSGPTTAATVGGW